MRWSRPLPATLPLFPAKKRKPSIPHPRAVSRKLSREISRLIPSNRLVRLLLLIGFLALIPPFFFHLRLRRFQQVSVTLLLNCFVNASFIMWSELYDR